jgi:tRNA A37 threonylcarbamoyltransferase TsaD
MILAFIYIFSVLQEAMVEAGNLTPKDIDAIAYTKGLALKYSLIRWKVRLTQSQGA